MPNFTKTITFGGLAVAAATGIAASQSLTAATKMTLSGSLVTAGVATMDQARRIIITPAANESTNFFTIVGTDRYGRPQTEVVPGVANPAVAQSTKDFLTVTSITPTSSGAGNASAGTNTVASSTPMVVDWNPNGNLIGCSTLVTGTVNYTIQEARDDFSPAWDLAANSPNWFNDPTFAASATNQAGNLPGPFTLIRILINSGVGTVQGKFITPFIGGAI